MTASLPRAVGLLVVTLIVVAIGPASTQAPRTDANTPLHLLKPDYPIPYGPPTAENVVEVIRRIRGYLDVSTPARIVDRKSGQPIADLAQPGIEPAIDPGAFRVTSYEWGVVYSGMLLAAETTGDPAFKDYVARRLALVGALADHYRAHPVPDGPLRSVVEPRALDDAGSLCAAMIKASRASVATNLRPMIDNFILFITTKEFRLQDGTLARNRPQPNTLWLDDLYMSVPALAQMGKLTGERKYYDDAVKQVLQFSQRMFNREQGLFMHGWVQGMEAHPEFRWARANGWALMALVELLDVLPADHPNRAAVIDLLRAHVRGLAARQSGSGFWHQLLDRDDSYLETSATAIYAYAMARAIDRGWIDPVAYGPAVVLAWNAVATKVNAQGQVEGTCVGTGMGFDPAFYYYRPTSPFAAHGYGPVLLAGAEMLRLLKMHRFEINDSSTQLYVGQDASRVATQTMTALLTGWEFVTDPPTPIAQVCTVKPDGVVGVSGSPVGYIATIASYRDYRLHAEWRWTGKPGNSGALVHISSGPKDRQWPVCFQVQWKNKAVGDLLPMAGATFAEALSTPPGSKTPQLNRVGVDSERDVGEWNSCDVICRGDVIEVTINGVVQNRVTGVSVAAGRVGFQLEGTPFELRNVSIAPLR
jgi:unsaturated rhamnogalacturonyl hydrolase